MRNERRGTDECLAEWGHIILPQALKIVFFPPLAAGNGKTYWGTDWLTLPDKAKELIGMHDTPSTDKPHLVKYIDVAKDILAEADTEQTVKEHMMQIKTDG